MNRRLFLPAFAVLAAAGCASQQHAPLPRDVAYEQLKKPARTDSPYSSLDTTARQRMAEGDLAGAQADFDNALQINPFDPIALNNLAVAKSENGQFHEAVALLERANRLAPENAEIAANLSRLRAYANSYTLAQEQGPVDDGGVVAAQSQSGLPPPPPPLWASLIPVGSVPPQGAGYYYEGCRPDAAPAGGKRRNGKASTAATCR